MNFSKCLESSEGNTLFKKGLFFNLLLLLFQSIIISSELNANMGGRK